MQFAPTTAEQVWADLMAGNRRFVVNQPARRDLAAERAAVALTQHPKAVIITCADSRVAPEIIFDQKLGDLFVIRGAGNTADALALGGVEFAVQELGVRVIVVLGHKRCGAVATAAVGEKLTSANLKAVVKRIVPAWQQASGEGEDRLRAAERINVRNATRDLAERSLLLADGIRALTLMVFGAYYDLDTGEVQRLL